MPIRSSQLAPSLSDNRASGTRADAPARADLLALGALALLAAALRLHGIGRWSLWFDEAISLLGSLDLASLATPNDVTQPLWVLLLSFWRRWAQSDGALRALSALFGVASVPLAWDLGRRLLGRAGGLWAALLLALAPFHVYYAQELRTYALWGFLTLAAWDAQRAAETRGGRRRWAAVGVLGALALYAHAYALAYWGAQAAAVLLSRDRAARRGFILATGVALLLFAPWAPVFLDQMQFLLTVPEGSRTAFSWLPGISWRTAAGTLANFTEGYHGANRALPLLVGALAVLGTLARPAAGARLWLLGGLPALALCLASTARMIFADRYLLPSSLALLLLAGAGLARLPKPLAAGAAALYAALALSPLHRLYANDLSTHPERRPAVNARMDFRAGAAAVARELRPGDWIVHTCENTVLPFDWYLRGVPGAERRYLLLDAPDPETGEIGPWPHAYRLDRTATPLPPEWERALPPRVWLVYSEWDWRNVAPNDARRDRIARLYGSRAEERFEGVWIDRLERPAAAGAESGPLAEARRAADAGRWEEALALLDAAEAAEGDAEERLALRARALEALGRDAEARVAWERLLAESDSEPLRRAASRHLEILDERRLTPPR